MKAKPAAQKDDLRPEYTHEAVGEGVRGKYFARYQKGTNLVLLNPEVAKAFPDSQAANDALRGLMTQRAKPAKPKTGPTRRKT